MTKKTLKKYFMPEKGKVKKSAKGAPLGMGWLGFIAPELAQFAYAALTAVVILFTWTSLEHPQELLWERVTMLSGTVALWIVYRLWPCRFMMLCRIGYLLLMLSSWYPDTYEINHQFGCLDHFFASYEQDLFGMQPALWFSRIFSSAVVSELMYMGYVSYYLFFVVTIIYIFFRDYEQVERVAYLVFAGFFICYVIYLFLPVTGPQYYYLAAGVEKIEHADFPDVGTYFAHSTECMKAPGWDGGLFYNLCMMAHSAGERPTAAFPSSHVAIATLVMIIVGRMRMWKYLLFLAVPYVFLCLSTVYIMAHYAIDALAGLVTGLALFLVLGGMKLRKAA